MKKVLIITYYWPPSGGAGVQRWLKFVKYLREFGWEPIVFTAEGGEVPVIDKSLEKDVPEGLEVITQKIWEPYSIYKKIIGQKKEDRIQTGFLTENKRPRILEKLSIWIRGNLFIPDARKFWIKPSVKKLTKYLKENDIDAIASNGPPHSTHMIALKLKEIFGLPWLADFRDPWTKIDFYDKLMLTKWADRKHHKMEAEVLKNADAIVTVSPSWARELEKLSGKEINVVYNGFDEDDMKDQGVELDTKFSISHIGSMNADRNPHMLWKAISSLCESDENFAHDIEIKMIGSTDISVKKSLEGLGLLEKLNKVQYLPHKEAIKTLNSSQLLLLPINDTPNSKGVIPGKLFEYLASKRPILCIGPIDGDSSKIIAECNAGKVFEFKDEKGISHAIQQFYKDFKKGQLETKSHGISKFTRKDLTSEMASLLNSIT